ncbi:hypothetical protein niasHS_000900 [Heterodera schachtii]|uniref:Hexosyltransferase n=1 Tax=Heterodera schachtii TaxID=97005 RepID=A0ABD2KI17_HETSC
MAFSPLHFLLFLCVGAILILLLYNTEVPQIINSTLNWKVSRNSAEKEEQLEEAKNDQKERRNKQFIVRFKNFRLKYRMEFEKECPEKTTLIMLSMARRDGFEKRKGIRETHYFWVPGEVIRFLIADASKGEAENIQQKLAEEQKRNGDLVFLHGFNDTYAHIHIKWYGGLQWQQSFCAGAEWVMKADDDSIVHLRRLAYWREKKFRQIVEQNPLVYIGYIYYNPAPIRNQNSKWYISEDVYPLDWYPDFMQGTVYLTTPATISAILSHSHEIVGFYLDDVVFTGILAELANVKLSDQKAHFIWGLGYDEKHGQCEDGVPMAFSMWGVGTMKDYEHHYGKLKSAKCK